MNAHSATRANTHSARNTRKGPPAAAGDYSRQGWNPRHQVGAGRSTHSTTLPTQANLALERSNKHERSNESAQALEKTRALQTTKTKQQGTSKHKHNRNTTKHDSLVESSTKINKIETKMKQTNKTTTKHINITRLEAKTKLGLKIQNYNHN